MALMFRMETKVTGKKKERKKSIDSILMNTEITWFFLTAYSRGFLQFSYVAQEPIPNY